MKKNGIKILLLFILLPYWGKSQDFWSLNLQYKSLIDSAHNCIASKKDSMALDYYLKAFSFKAPYDPVVLYEAAAISARLKHKDMAFMFLNQATEKGYSYYSHFLKNKDFPALDHKSYEYNLQKMKKTDELYDSISTVLDSIYKLDQDIRDYYFDQLNLGKVILGSIEDEKIIDSMKIIDHKNVEAVDGIFNKYGFLGKSLKTPTSRIAMFIIYLHAPIEIKEKIVPAMQKAMEKGEVDRHLYAYMEDKLMLSKSNVQKYGTQYNKVDGKIVIEDLLHPEKVDEYRKEVGLGTLKEYIESIENEQ